MSITLHETESGPVRVFAVAGTDGKYQLEYDGAAETVYISVSGINIEKTVISVPNRSQTLDFTVEEKVTEIKEITIRQPKISQRGDTLNYNVASFTDIGDRTIADALRNMPGIEVSESGEIRYQNRPINKFYIEDLDLLQGRYGLATTNIKAKDVATVQVMENHQPIRALRNIEFVDEAAINLKLKDSAKGVFIANAQAGLGASPVLWSNEVTGMYFASQRQDMIIYKGDNSGRDVGRELNMLYGNPLSDGEEGRYLSVLSPSPPGISQEMYLFNDSHIGSVNDLKKISNHYTLTTNLNYLFDRTDRKSAAFEEYYLPGDDIIAVEDKTNSRHYKNRLNTDLDLEANTDNFYLKNNLRIGGQWDRESGRTITDENVYQHLREPTYDIANSFDYIAVKENKTVRLSSVTTYRDLEQTLLVSPFLYADFFGYGNMNGGSMEQIFDTGNFITKNYISLNNKTGDFDLDIRFGINNSLQNLKTALTISDGLITYGNDSLRNRIRRNHFESVFTPILRYKPNIRFQISLRVPLSWQFITRNDHVSGKKVNTGFFFVNPSLNATYRLSAKFTSTVSYKLQNRTGSIYDIYSGYIMSDYRSISQYIGDETKTRTNHVSWGLDFKNPVTTLFGIFSVNYSDTRSPLLNEYEYDGILKIKNSVAYSHNNKNILSFFRVGKDIQALGATISLGGTGGYRSSSQLIEGHISSIESYSFSLSPSYKQRFSNYLTFDYSFNATFTKYDIGASTVTMENFKLYSQVFKVTGSPMKNLTISASFEHFYNNMIDSGSRHSWFGDVSIRYKLQKMDIRLDYTNIFNNRSYISVFQDENVRSIYTYTLRPQEVMLRLRFKLY